MKLTAAMTAALAAAFVAGGATAQGYAQPTGAAATYATPGGYDAPAQARGRRADWTARREARLSALRTAIALRPEQEPAFRAFLEARRPDRAAMARRRAERARLMSLPVPDRMQAWLARRPERDAMMRRRTDATLRFYAALSPEQQRAFDAYTRDHHGRWGGPGRGAMRSAPPQG